MVSEPAAESWEDSLRPFQVEGLDVRGRAVTLGVSLNEILRKHDYPEPVARLLGEAILLAAMFGASLKADGRFIFQTNTDGPVSLIVVDYRTPGTLRGYARFDRQAVEALAPGAGASAYLGNGHLAMTIDQGTDTNRYQGIVALQDKTLEEAVHEYFLKSEQIPTHIRVAVAEVLSRDKSGETRHAWRGGGVMVQFLPEAPDRVTIRDLPGGDDPHAPGAAESESAQLPEAEDDAWIEARMMTETIEDHELTDPDIGSDRLLYRLFHERGVRVFEPNALRHQCQCSRDKITGVIGQFSAQDRTDMIQDGKIVVTCEFCNSVYEFEPTDFPD